VKRFGCVWSFTLLGGRSAIKESQSCVIAVHIEAGQLLVLGYFDPESPDKPTIGMSVECDAATDSDPEAMYCQTWRKASR
jgi:uncharacterized OB-fold protein